MKTEFLSGILIIVFTSMVSAQDSIVKKLTATGRWSLIGKATTNVCIANVIDDDQRPSAEVISADGYTTSEGTINTASLGGSIEYRISNHFAVSAGTWFTNRILYLRNTDGNYSDVSKYNILYVQMPLLFKFYTRELYPGLKLYFHTGPSLDLKIGERLDGYDGAHYWNMAKNKTYADPFRGTNGDHRSMDLWAPIDFSLYFGSGIQYQILNNLALFAGLSYNQGFVNMFNPALRFDDAAKTPVASTCYINTSLIGIDLGVKYNLK
jgi:hypothetical protein